MSDSPRTRPDLSPRSGRGAVDARALMNPAFAAGLITTTADAYSSDTLPLVYAYLVGPFVLNDTVRTRLPKTVGKRVSNWVADNPVARSDLRRIAHTQSDDTKAALRFGLRHELFTLDSAGIRVSPQGRLLPEPGTPEALACWKAADFLGRWLSRSDGPVTTLALLGLTP